jgi:hypothetical protein
MDERLLISKEDFYEYENIHTQTDPVMVMPYVKQAQQFDLPDVINKELIADVIENMDTELNQTLLKYIKPVLVYYSHARYVMQRQGATDSAYGFVQKTNEFSQPSSEKSIVRIASESRSLASAYARLLIEFLEENKTDYPLWESGCSGIKIKSFPRITPVSRT